MPELDQKVTSVFAGRVVRKDLVRKVKVGANVPVFVLEYLLGKYCATDDQATMEAGLKVVNSTLADNFVRPDEANKAQSFVREKGKHTIIDKVKVRYLSEDDKYWAEFVNFGHKYVHIPELYVQKYDRILMGGIWAQVDLIHRFDEEARGKRSPFWIEDLKPIQLASFDLPEYLESRRQFTSDEWIDLLIRSIGMEPSHFDRRLKLLFLIRAGSSLRAKLQPHRAGTSWNRQVLRLSGVYPLCHTSHRPNDCGQLILQHRNGQDGSCRSMGCSGLR
jgi:ATP-dependent Lon protease